MDNGWFNQMLWVVALLCYLVVVAVSLIHTFRLRELTSRLEQILGWALILHRENQDAAPDSGSGSQRRVEP